MGFRYVVLLLAFTGVVFCYVTRACFSVALVSMVTSSGTSNRTVLDNSCSENQTGSKNQTCFKSLNESKPDAATFGETYDWDTDTQSFMLGALFYGCLVSQFPSGILVQHFSVKWMFGLTSLTSAVLLLLTPLASSWSSGAVIAIRVVQGLLQGIQSPAASHVVSRWFPTSERSRAFSVLASGPSIGNIVGMLVSGILAYSGSVGGWPSIFYVFGAFGCVWSFLWMALVSDAPQQHKCVTDEELKVIMKEREGHSFKKAAVPWRALLTSVPFWSCSLAAVGQLTSLFVMTTQLPLYLSNVFHFDIRSSGALAAVPFLAKFIMALAGSYIADALRQSGKLSVTFIRKLMNSVGIFGFCLCLAVIAFVGSRTSLIVILLCVSNGISGISISGCMVTIVDLSPTFSATITGMSITFAYISGAVMPYVFGLFTKSGHTEENWSSAFLLCAGLIFATGLQFLIFGSAERQSWDAVEQKRVDGLENPALETEQSEQVESTKL